MLLLAAGMLLQVRNTGSFPTTAASPEPGGPLPHMLIAGTLLSLHKQCRLGYVLAVELAGCLKVSRDPVTCRHVNPKPLQT